MKSGIDHVIHAAIRKPATEVNALYLPYDGWFEWIFQNSGVRCYSSAEATAYDWLCGEYPPNINLLPKGMNYIPNRVDLDVVICNHRKDQVIKAANVADAYHLPLILIEHELPFETSKSNLRQYVNSRMPKRVVHVVTDQLVNEEWGLHNTDREVVHIPYGLVGFGSEVRDIEVLVFGDYTINDYSLLELMLASHPKSVGFGNNPGTGTQPFKKFKEVQKALGRSKVCLTAHSSMRPPFGMFLAMAAGCAVITNKTRWSSRFIEHGKTGFLFERGADIKKVVKDVCADEALKERVGMAGRKAILEQFSVDKFQSGWHNLIEQLSTRTYVR